MTKNTAVLFHLICILMVAFTCRFLFLDTIPTGITNDELDYVLNAKSIWKTGKDMSQLWAPYFLTPPTGTFPMAELPSVLMAPFIGPLPLSLFNARFGYAFFGSFLSILLYFLANRLFHSKKISFIVGLCIALNPWAIFFSRTGLDAPIAVFFYYLFFFFALSKNSFVYILSLLSFSIAFFSYIGTKLIAIPIALLPLILHDNKRNHLPMKAGMLILLGFGLTVFFIYNAQHASTKTRMNELFFPTSTIVSSDVDNERKLSLPSPVTHLFANKVTSYVNISLTKYLNAFSPNLLFLNGDTRSAFSVWTHGYFYIIDILFFLYGFAIMFHTHKKQLIFLLGIILLAPIPTVLSTVGVSYPIRSSLLFPSLILIIGYGISAFTDTIKTKKVFLPITLLIISVYLFSAAHFLFIYIFRNPVANSEGFDFSSRIISSYLLRSSRKTPVTVFTGSPKTLYKQYIFYANTYDKNTMYSLANSSNETIFSVHAITFKTCAQFDEEDLKTTYIVEPSLACQIIPKKDIKIEIAQLSDAGTIYRIYNDRLCNPLQRLPYPRLNTLNDLHIENLTDNNFCRLYITGENK